jgi:hypothetical protein
VTRNRATARRAGYDAEADLVTWLRLEGATHAERRVPGSAKDRGDVAGVPGVVFEVKFPGRDMPVRLGPWMDETLRERDNDGADLGLLVIRRPMRLCPADWAWCTDGTTMTRLLRAGGWLPTRTEADR